MGNADTRCTAHLGLAASLFTLVGCYVPVERGSFDSMGPDPAGQDAPPGGDDPAADGDDGAADEAPPAPRAQLRRLTRAQYAGAIADLVGDAEPFGAETPPLDPDLVVDLYTNVGATTVTTSELATEQFETAASLVAATAFADADAAAALVGCDPAAADCLHDFASAFARRAFGRPLAADEVESYAATGQDVAVLRDDPWAGAEAIVAAVLASPSFLYLAEIGEPDPDHPDRWRFTSLEMARRLSFTIWGSIPDEELLLLGESGALVMPDTINEQAARMMADPRARGGIGRFVAEWLGADALAGLTKDPDVFPDASPELFASMRGELTRLAESIALHPERSMLALLDAEETFVDARLAAHYGIEPPTEVDAEGFGAVPWGAQSPRRGVLGTAGILAAQSRRTRTAPTLRGIYVQTRLRCVEVAPPPPDAAMDIPDDAGDPGTAATVRERLEEHRENPACAACHDIVDPIGLALELFDAIGRYRDTDAGLPIDDTAELDGEPLEGIGGLTELLRADPVVAACVVRQLYRFSTGHRERADEEATIDALAASFEQVDFNLVQFLPQLVSSAAFRTLATPE
ncbi:MAG: DUF1592 domain-containing protein [Myxococcota bacterium]